MRLPRVLLPLVAVAAGLSPAAAEPLLTLDTVAIGNAGNAPANAANVTYDASLYSEALGYGAVDYDYRMGTTEVTIGQYQTFLNAVASVPIQPYLTALWNTNMEADGNVAGIHRSGAGTLAEPYVYTVVPGSANRPITYVSWFDAARFVNWVQNGATRTSDTETGAYTLNGATTGMISRNPDATWWLPNEDEWYKAAYYSPELVGGTGGYTLYATQSNTLDSNVIGAPGAANYNDGVYATTQQPIKLPDLNYLTDVGAYPDSPSYYGTFDQSGNVWEWTDSPTSDTRFRIRNGSWIDADESYLSAAGSLDAPPTLQLFDIGFRVATVPEPATWGLLLMSGIAFLGWRSHRAASGR